MRPSKTRGADLQPRQRRKATAEELAFKEAGRDRKAAEKARQDAIDNKAKALQARANLFA